MKLLPLTHGQSAKVGDEDYARLSIYKWSATMPLYGRYYAVRGTMTQGKRSTIYLQHAVTGCPIGTRLKFRDGDSLNCQRANIIVVPPGKAALRRKSEGRIQPIAVCSLAEIASHPLRGIYRDVRLSVEGGYLVKVLGTGPSFVGPYRTIERASSVRDAEEGKRRDLKMPPIPWEKVYRPSSLASATDLLEELL